MTTISGQMTSVYEYPKPALLILGGSTIAAIAVGLGWEERVWCRHLCPVSGVFGLLAKVSPLHYKVDQAAWDKALAGHRTSHRHVVNCAPLINIRRMESASACHMCGRCAGERNAVQLALRSPNAEIIGGPKEAEKTDRWLARLPLWATAHHKFWCILVSVARDSTIAPTTPNGSLLISTASAASIATSVERKQGLFAESNCHGGRTTGKAPAFRLSASGGAPQSASGHERPVTVCCENVRCTVFPSDLPSRFAWLSPNSY